MSIFGLKGIFKDYSCVDICQDFGLPVVISSILTTTMKISKSSSYQGIIEILNLGIVVVPILITLILTAYVLLLSMLSGKLNEFCHTTAGEKLYNRLNSGFAANLVISLVSLICVFMGTFIAKMGIHCEKAEIFNICAYFIYVIIVSYPIFCLFGIVIDLFNIGVASKGQSHEKHQSNKNTPDPSK